MLGINGCGMKITHTVLQTSLVQEFIQPLVKDVDVRFLVHFCRRVNVANLRHLESLRSIERPVTNRERRVQLPSESCSPR